MPSQVTPTASEASLPEGYVEWEFRGVKYVFRELTVEENDACIDGALSEDKNTINNRTMTRLMIIKSAVEPKGFGLKDLTKLPVAAYERIREIVDALNDPDKIPAVPNSLTPDTSGEPK